MTSSIFTPRFLILLILVLAISLYGTYLMSTTNSPLNYRQFNQQIDAALEHSINGNHFEAVKVFIPLAQMNVPRAKLYLAVAYYHGRGINRDISKSRTLFFELQKINFEPHIVSTYLNLISSLPQSSEQT